MPAARPWSRPWSCPGASVLHVSCSLVAAIRRMHDLTPSIATTPFSIAASTAVMSSSSARACAPPEACTMSARRCSYCSMRWSPLATPASTALLCSVAMSLPIASSAVSIMHSDWLSMLVSSRMRAMSSARRCFLSSSTHAPCGTTLPMSIDMRVSIMRCFTCCRPSRRRTSRPAPLTSRWIAASRSSLVLLSAVSALPIKTGTCDSRSKPLKKRRRTVYICSRACFLFPRSPADDERV